MQWCAGVCVDACRCAVTVSVDVCVCAGEQAQEDEVKGYG